MKRYHSEGGVTKGTVIALIIFALVCVAGGWYLGRNLTWKGEALIGGEEPRETRRPEPARVFEPSSESMILEDKLSEIALTASPSVVNVFAEKTVKMGPRFPFFNDPLFRFFFGPGEGEPRERRQRSLGSGVIVSRDGYVLTNHHVIREADAVLVALSDEREFKAEVVGTDSLTDLAVLKIETDDLPVLPLGNSDKVRVGQVVLAIGNPFGLSSTVTMGIVSARGRSGMGITGYEDFIQTDAAINPGNSGGALINLSGELIGINTAIFSRSGGYQGIGFAVPSNMAGHVMDSLIETGTVKRGWLGVSIQDLTPELAEQFGLDEARGALVAEVLSGTPAAEAGIKAGDVIVSVDGREIKDNIELRNRIAEYSPGTEVEIGLIREGEKERMKVELGERPGEKELAGGDFHRPKESGEAQAAGMHVADLTSALADRLDIEKDVSGVVVVDVESGSRASRAGVMVGDLVFRLNRMAIEDVDDFELAARRAGSRPMLLHVRRRGSNIFMVIPSD